MRLPQQGDRIVNTRAIKPTLGNRQHDRHVFSLAHALPNFSLRLKVHARYACASLQTHSRIVPFGGRSTEVAAGVVNRKRQQRELLGVDVDNPLAAFQAAANQ